MKCENCGRNEANFVYRSSINGRTEELTSARPVPKSWAILGVFFDQRPSVMDSSLETIASLAPCRL